MAHTEQSGPRSGGVSRRKVILTGAGLAAAGVVVGAAVPLVTAQQAADGSAEVETQTANPAEPVMVHLRDAVTGHFDVFVGTRRVQVTDRAFAARLAKAATA